MINKSCSVITDSEAFFGTVRSIDEIFLQIQINEMMVMVPLMRIKTITYEVENFVKPTKTKKTKVQKETVNNSNFLESIKKKMQEEDESVKVVTAVTAATVAKIAELGVAVLPELDSDVPSYHQLKKQSLNDFIPNKKSK